MLELHIRYHFILFQRDFKQRLYFLNEVNSIISEQDSFCFNTMHDNREYAVSFTVKKKILLVRKSAVNSVLLLQISSLHTEQ